MCIQGRNAGGGAGKGRRRGSGSSIHLLVSPPTCKKPALLMAGDVRNEEEIGRRMGNDGNKNSNGSSFTDDFYSPT